VVDVVPIPSLSDEVTSDNDAITLSYGTGWGLFNSSIGPVKAFCFHALQLTGPFTCKNR
jgi:hypothetical protein